MGTGFFGPGTSREFFSVVDNVRGGTGSFAAINTWYDVNTLTINNIDAGHLYTVVLNGIVTCIPENNDIQLRVIDAADSSVKGRAYMNAGNALEYNSIPINGFQTGFTGVTSISWKIQILKTGATNGAYNFESAGMTLTQEGDL